MSSSPPLRLAVLPLMASDGSPDRVEVRDSLLPSRIIVNVQRLGSTEPQASTADSDDEDDDELSRPQQEGQYTKLTPQPSQPSRYTRSSVLSTAVVCFPARLRCRTARPARLQRGD